MDKLNKTIAAFDFDETITTKDTLFDFIRFYKGIWRLSIGVVILSPVLVLFKLGFIKNSRAKEILFTHFFGGEKIAQFDAVCQRYSARINVITRPKALEEINAHLAKQHTTIIVSASIDRWIIPWAKMVGFAEVVGTQIEIIDGIVTGKFLGENCYGQEKVNRLLKLYPNREAYTLHAYGDSSGDKELLALADHPYFRKF